MVAVLVLLSFLTACNRQVGWVSLDHGNTFEATYQLFNGKKAETLPLQAGESLIVAYDVRVDKGSLTLQLSDPRQDIIYEATYYQDMEGVFELTPQQDGPFTLRVIGVETRGGFDFQWELGN